ncbi:hypothetical protein BD410DRAFT_796382 [Rickenella mellea]|uniref:Uncharacterized protein n=1 Tax=Rickenella mellea TaxID=50990 RepID=A0A4Y7PKX2_9AGAM|nr:hypothetical protein BD410DRAFT_796382 [Rickenella mellea]
MLLLFHCAPFLAARNRINTSPLLFFFHVDSAFLRFALDTRQYWFSVFLPLFALSEGQSISAVISSHSLSINASCVLLKQMRNNYEV